MIDLEHGPYAQMTSHAESIFPDECCGFIFGKEDKAGNRRITVLREVNNAKPGNKKRRFEINGLDYMQSEVYALDNDLELLGVYHSHPNHPAVPSEHDRVAAQPTFSYIIVSVMKGRIDHIRSWQLNEDTQFVEEFFSPELINQSI